MNKKLGCISMLLLTIHALWAIILPDGSDVIIKFVEKYDDGSIQSVILAEDASFAAQMGMFTLHAESTVSFYRGGKVQSVIPAQDTEIKTASGVFLFRAGKTVDFYENGHVQNGYLTYDKMIAFYEDGSIQSINPIKDMVFRTKYGNLTFIGEKSRMCNITMYPNGYVKSGYLKHNQTIQTAVGTIEPHGAAEFYEDGTFKSVTVTQSTMKTILGELTVSKLFFDESSALSKCEVVQTDLPKGTYDCFEASEPITVYGEVEFYASGTIKSLFLNSDGWIKTNIGKIKINNLWTSPIHFYENGHLKSAERIEPQVFETPIGLLAITGLFFSPSGRFDRIIAAQAVQLPPNYAIYTAFTEDGFGISPHPVPPCHEISFHENGTVRHISIYPPYPEAGIVIPGTFLRKRYGVSDCWFYENGNCMGIKTSDGQNPYFVFSEKGMFLEDSVIDEATGRLQKAP